jgi:hypothetical protein
VTDRLAAHVRAALGRPVDPAVRHFAALLGQEAGGCAVLFYGSNLRTGSLDGVLDFYVLLPGAVETGLWPRVSYRELAWQGITLRAKIATMSLATFSAAAAGDLLDSTIWARFVQPSAMAWRADDGVQGAIEDALAAAAVTAARLAAALGPEVGAEAEFWKALFRATYRAEFRVERPGREDSILALNPGHFAGLLPLGLAAAGIAHDDRGDRLRVDLPPAERTRIMRWWRKRRRAGRPLNVVRLLRASTTFDGAARYAAWKIERHTGIPVPLTPWRERHPLLAAPAVLWQLWQHRRRR